ncbi:unnamed protein product [Rhizophagus irregularis]|uniref:Uncharacterized protein n=2 Tax=Rhizophagus irregularis TaxID=588596 RepID=A0A916EDF1_9GLOM|nr:unnamed protein product [Rhizophagus irregularis]CAB5379578.1 unnamed protein product [Rhizophagus irregularis]
MAYYGKCKFEDPLTGRRCGCQRLSVTGSIQDNLCRCLHHECYHELSFYPYTFGYAGPLISYNIDEMVDQIPSNISNNCGNRQRKAFLCICLLYENSNSILKIPRIIKGLISEGLVKSTHFNDDSDDGIKKKIEALFPRLRGGEWQFFRCISTAHLEAVTAPENGWTIDELKKLGLRLRLGEGDQKNDTH